MMGQNPGAAQDAEAAREKLLKASDQIDMIQSNSEATKLALTSMKADIAQLQADNAALKQQVADLHSELDRSEAEQAKERQALIDKVADLIASTNKGSAKSIHKHAAADDDSVPPQASHHTMEVHSPDGESAAGAGANPVPAPTGNPDSASAPTETVTTNVSLTPPADEAPPKPQKGYYHIVEAGETLTMICTAYRQQGVKVSVAQVRKANGLTDKSVLKVGQKLFIPKPGT